jgi:diadenosine tetraphosphatase ApaH/serine/threonine PP2A family protein phosphatase
VRVAVFSDVHGNLHALEAVLSSLAAESPDEVWCLGDVVGYGPRPNRCCALVAERADLCLIGNHDLAILGRIDLDEFMAEAAESARWTASVLEDSSRAFLEPLSSSASSESVGLYHASPRDPVWEYVLTPQVVVASLYEAEEPIVLVGHSHVALAFGLDESLLSGGLAPDGTEFVLAEGARSLLNPGSVGQPRDGDPRAAWMLLDLERRTASFRREPYPVEKTQAELRERGLPEALAERLEQGL